MSIAWHIVERAFLHICMGTTVYLGAFFALRWGMRKNPVRTMAVLPALLSIGFIGWREAWDVAHGQPLLKAFTDYASWAGGMALGLWLLYRYRKENVWVLKVR